MLVLLFFCFHVLKRMDDDVHIIYRKGLVAIVGSDGTFINTLGPVCLMLAHLKHSVRGLHFLCFSNHKTGEIFWGNFTFR